MNEEEKKAIEKIKEIIECFYCFPNPTSIELKDCDCSTLEILLNLIEKLQKENEELKSNNEKYIIHLTDGQYKTVIEIAQNDINQKWIQKVKDKIEEYKNMLKTCNKAKDIDRIKAINERILELEELLEGRK